MPRRSRLLFCVAFCAACRASEWVPHPRNDQLVATDAPVTEISLQGEAGLPSAATSLVEDLSRASSGETLGLFEGAAALEFGSIRGVQRDPYGRIVVLDDQASELRVFTEVEGTFEIEGVVGGAGNGPGELQAPRGLRGSMDGSLLVFNRVGRVDRFASDKDGLTWSGRRQFPASIEDVCTIGDTLIISAVVPDNGHTVHFMDEADQRIRSFGELYRTDNERLRRHIQRARVHCLDDGGVLLAPLLLPELRRFSSTGDVRWRVHLEGSRSVYLATNSSDGNVAIGTPGRWLSHDRRDTFGRTIRCHRLAVGVHRTRSSSTWIGWTDIDFRRPRRNPAKAGSLENTFRIFDTLTKQ